MGGRSIVVAGTPPQTLRFEWDPAKSASNKTKHGIDFDEATAIWHDRRRVEIPAGTPEPRVVNIGLLNGKLHTAITTMRGEVTRVISARRSSSKEVADYVRRNGPP